MAGLIRGWVSSVMAACFLLASLPCAGQEAAGSESSTVVDQKIDKLLSQMTLEEKVGQLRQSFHFFNSKVLDDKVIAGEFGSFEHEQKISEMNRLQHLAVDKSRLHIPLAFEADVVHGYEVMFPVPLGMASSFDMNMIKEVQETAAFEARRGGVRWNAAPMLDIARDPRWGRVVEGAGEDPFLGARVAEAQVKGFQGESGLEASDHMAVALKHFAGYGFGEGGRDHDAVYLPEDQLRNVVLKPFKAAVDAGARTVMDAYVDLNDVPASGNRWLLTDVLRTEWGFRGVVISDNNAVSDLVPHGFAKDREDADIRALNAGVDVAMSNFGEDYKELLNAGKDGRLDVAELDQAVRRMLKLKFDLGLFDHPFVDEYQMDDVTYAKHLALARIAADRSSVLLRNAGDLLPLRNSSKQKVAVIGALADSKQDTIGPWNDGWAQDKVVTVKQALAESGQFAAVTYAQGIQLRRVYRSPFDILMKEKAQPAWSPEEADKQFQNAVDIAKQADVVIAVMGEMQNMSGESASRSSLDLPGRQEELLKAISALGKPIVLVLFNGRPLTISWEAEHIPSILEMWYPGTEGGHALLDLLLGTQDPGGKLPMTFPRNSNQIPIYYDHNSTQDPKGQATRYWDYPSTALYPFGYGLSYTSFSFANARALTPTVRRGDAVTLEAEVTNTGKVSGDVVAQLYLHQRYGTTSRPMRELKSFSRIGLKPGESRTVRFVVPAEELSFWSTATRSWVQDVTDFDFWIGEDSTADLRGSFSVSQ